jgi:hypothetical protein
VLATYKARIKDGRVQWRDVPPPISTEQEPVEVLVTLLQEESETENQKARGRKMAEALRKIAGENRLSEISDAAQWEREIRQDRSLPGRST